jgi:hypothetical protein
MKKFTNIFNLSNIIKILIIFLIGFASRIIINYSLGVSVFLDYTHYISMLYYLSLLLLTVCIDQLFSFDLYISVDSFNKITLLNNDFKITNFLFTKHNKNPYFSPSSIDPSPGYCKTSRNYTTINSQYVYLRPVVNAKGDIILVPGLNPGKDNLESNPNIPPAPKPSNLSSPSTMSPLFPGSSHIKSTSNVPIQNYKRLTQELAERKLRIIDSVRFEKSKSKSRSTICDKISSGLNYADSHLKSKFFKELSQEEIKKRDRKRELEL